MVTLKRKRSGRPAGSRQPVSLRLLPHDDPEEVKITYASAYTGLSVSYLKKNVIVKKSGATLTVSPLAVNAHLQKLFS